MPETAQAPVTAAAVALGSNLPSRFGDREATLLEAVARLRALGNVLAVSSFRETEPVGYTDQPRFLNGAALLATTLHAPGLMDALLAIERSMGRDRAEGIAKGPRVIDLDLLLFGDAVLATEHLTLPHPELSRRRFVLEPLAEIAPEWVHPVTGQTIRAMLEALDASPD